MKHETQKTKTENTKTKRTFFRHMFHVSCFTFHEKGFTLIELMVSIAIVGILASTIIANTRFGERQQALAQAAQKLVLDLRKAQNSALAPGAENDCIYGINRISGSRYRVYKRSEIQCLDNRREYDSPPNGSSELEIVDMPKGISWAGNGIRDIAFEAPEPITYLDNSSSTNSGEIRLLSSINNTTKKVIINRLGQMEIR